MYAVRGCGMLEEEERMRKGNGGDEICGDEDWGGGIGGRKREWEAIPFKM